MNQQLILYPLLPMFLLVCIVAGTMLNRRITFYKSNKVHPQKTATSAQMAATITDSRAPDNFRNLFELPVMFYVAVLVLFVTQLVCWPQVIFAWCFVAGRYAHSFVHCGSNNVMRRFYAFLFSNFFLVCMWGMLAWQLLTLKQG